MQFLCSGDFLEGQELSLGCLPTRICDQLGRLASGVLAVTLWPSGGQAKALTLPKMAQASSLVTGFSQTSMAVEGSTPAVRFCCIIQLQSWTLLLCERPLHQKGKSTELYHRYRRIKSRFVLYEKHSFTLKTHIPPFDFN